ncbi:N-acetylmuramoyl-L-alanine amidase family protein [Clostridium beijerinckii]|uniref:N-acetylmuramoyl-L-alanine amidase family protein n=1 Tax=Clostridium beijerinckii TaxID=1520 RepID=UPI00232CCC54|nr:cadherin-like beta sandwich domain-containing protein [Clostridium beijerinckii]
MSKIENRFIALLVVFTSIVSFFSLGFLGQVAKADDIADAQVVTVNITGENTALTSRIDPTTKEVIYSTTELLNQDGSQPDKGFDITVKNVSKSVSDLESQAKGNGMQSGAATGVTYQEIQLVSINDVPITDTVSLKDLGIRYADISGIGLNGQNIIGKRIVGLALGINEISYKIIYKTRTVSYTPTLDSNQKPTGTGTFDDGKEIEHSSTSNSKMTIEQATTFVTQQIQSLLYKSYVGKASDFGPNDEISNDKNNKAPFLYTQVGEPDADMPLRYSFYVPDSTDMLKYIINFRKDLSSAEVYKNGVKDSGIDTSSNSLQGSLGSIGESALIVLKVTGVDDSIIAKSYAIKIKYSALDASKDFSIKEAGITKLDYNDDNTVAAYIGKTFNVTKDAQGFAVYNGKIVLDPRARMVSVDPTLICGKGSVGYVITNNYKDSAGKTVTEKSVLKNGKQFVDFLASSTSNQIQVDVYPGSNGSVTDSSHILARYCLDVVAPDTSGGNFNMGLTFGNGVTLTQPGVKGSVLDFNSARRTYDLYYGSIDPVSVAFSGSRSNKNEYIKVFFADSADSTNLKEATESLANEYNNDPTSADYLKRNTSIDVSIGTARKMVVQAYYDEFKDEKQADGTTKKVLSGSYPVGNSYVFYLPENDNGSGSPTPGQNSNNALLNSLKIKGYTLTDSDGNASFSSDKSDYTVTVAKEDTTEKITATAQDDNIKSIVANINGSDSTYNLVSGQATDIPLNSNGTTTIKIVVTAQDGTTTKTYNIVIVNNSKGANANLKNIILNVGDYNFDPKEDVTKVRVDQNVNSIKVTPITEDSKATASVNGEEYSDSAINVSLKGAQKTEISIEVKSEDGTESKTYTLEVYRVDPSDWNNDDNNNSSGDDDQFYDNYNDCWVDLTKYDEWGTVNGKPAYFDKKSRQVKNAWISTGGKYYYLNNLGYRASGWKVDDKTGQTYYLDPTTGEMRKGWMNLNNSWYYLGLNGVMKKGWLNLNGKWYYFTPNGQMVVNQSMYIDDGVYKFGQDGAMY